MSTFKRQVQIIFALREENRLLRRQLEMEQRRQRQQRCVYCGTPTRTDIRVCAQHRDIVE